MSTWAVWTRDYPTGRVARNPSPLDPRAMTMTAGAIDTGVPPISTAWNGNLDTIDTAVVDPERSTISTPRPFDGRWET
jgi:hypothetical protein